MSEPGAAPVDPADALVAVVRRLHARGLAPGTGGNMSAVAPGGELLVTASGVDKGRLTVDDLVRVDGAGRQRANHDKPSAKTALHLTLVAHGADTVLHMHSI